MVRSCTNGKHVNQPRGRIANGAGKGPDEELRQRRVFASPRTHHYPHSSSIIPSSFKSFPPKASFDLPSLTIGTPFLAVASDNSPQRLPRINTTFSITENDHRIQRDKKVHIYVYPCLVFSTTITVFFFGSTHRQGDCTLASSAPR